MLAFTVVMVRVTNAREATLPQNFDQRYVIEIFNTCLD